MDVDDNYNSNNNEMWEWREEYSLQTDSRNNFSHFLWDEVNPNEDDFLHMLEQQTPIKDCADFGCQISDIGDITNKGLEESEESSQLKRRRMLQFTSDTNEADIGSEEGAATFLKSKAREFSVMEDGLSESLKWTSQLAVGFSECNNILPEMENDVVQETPAPAPPVLFKGRKSYIKTPAKLTSSIAYPFSLIKPCGVQGDVTLNDINQRILASPPSRLKHKKDEETTISYPTSAYSGKPVVVKTKICTEGGKGSITIMRTKG